ncbi:hypothetical protein [Schleiferilactobacillus harbinensis]|jgi:Rgg/GadR/MutR family transcriptional activator|uniref:helix-turn-helix domain-containing protein n=1 Tax=Schleiferilactobacillus harbinensis TaxID=304207 RepID=UPI0039EADA3C
MPDNSGIVFHSFRVNDRKMSIEQASAGIMSASALRRFEQGKTSPYLETILPLLDRLRITPSEFFARKNDFEPTWTSSFYGSVTDAYNHHDLITLGGMFSKLHEALSSEPTDLPFYHLDKVTIQSATGMLQATPLPSNDVSFAMTYLKSQRNWFFYDLNMLRYLPTFLDREDLVWLAQNIFSHASAYINVLNNADLVTDIVVNIAISLIASAKEYDEAANLLELSHQNTVLRGKLEFSIQRKVLEAAIEFHQGNPEAAEKKHALVLSTLKSFDAVWDIQQVETLWPLLIKKD